MIDPSFLKAQIQPRPAAVLAREMHVLPRGTAAAMIGAEWWLHGITLRSGPRGRMTKVRDEWSSPEGGVG
jgi:hypothetical protein